MQYLDVAVDLRIYFVTPKQRLESVLKIMKFILMLIIE